MYAVRYRLMPHTSMPHGPALVHLAPSGRLTVLVDDRYLDPALAAALEEFSTTWMQRFTRVNTPSPSPRLRVRIHPTRDVGGKLLAAEFSVSNLDLLVDKELIRPSLAKSLSAEGTQIMRHFM